MNWPDILTALGAAGGGGILLKTMEHWLNRGKTKFDEKQQFINDLKEELVSQKSETRSLKELNDKLEQTADELRMKSQNLHYKTEMWKLNIANELAKKSIRWEDIPGLNNE
ncbi:MAG: hypothetical protein ABW007_06305 [Chitinophagaceae bacterium]